MEGVLGAEVVGHQHNDPKKLETIPVASLKGKYVGIYFSAHWCGPCRGFTPKLIEFYNEHKKTKSDFEVVFVSSDHNAEAFEEYFGSMPWLAIPYEDERRDSLSEKFEVRGIPTFVLVDPEGKTITKDGRKQVMEDPHGAEFPWLPRPVWDLVGPTVVNNKGETVAMESVLKNDIIAIYFSAHWCGPCQMFTPELAKWYSRLRDLGKKIEIIFASADRSEEDFKHYFETMPWLSIGYDSAREKALSAKFEVEGIPTLIFLAPDGKVITDDGRGFVDADPEGKDFPYGPKPFSELTPAVINTLNHSRCIVAFVDHLDPTNADAVVSAIRPRVEAYVKDHPIVDGCVRFLWAGEHDLVGRVREFMGVTEEDSPFLLYMHVAKRVKAVRSLVEDAAVTFDQVVSEVEKGTIATVAI